MAGQLPTKNQHWLYYAHFNDPTLSDLTLKLSDGTVVYAHRVVLCRRSKYFSKLILGGFNETNRKEIALNDDEPAAMLAMIRFLYGLPYEADEPHWHDDKTMLPHAQVYTVAEKYELENLKVQVHKNMVKLIRVSGDKPDQTDLIETIRQIIETTPDTDTMARSLVIYHYVHWLPQLIQQSEFIALLEEHGKLGAAVITAQQAKLRLVRGRFRSPFQSDSDLSEVP